MSSQEIGRIEAIFRYPVKSMAGESLDSADLGWHGIEGDRRLAFRRIEDRGGFPWLSAGKLPELLLFSPHSRDAGGLPSHIRTPDGRELETFSDDLAAEIGRLHGSPVQMMHMRQGVFDEGSVSIIATDTVQEIARLAGQTPDARKFRPNILLRTNRALPFEEDTWVGSTLSFGDPSPTIAVTLRDERCGMLNLDPDTARPAPEMFKAVVRVNQNTAGVYGTVTRTGRLSIGQPVFLHK